MSHVAVPGWSPPIEFPGFDLLAPPVPGDGAIEQVRVVARVVLAVRGGHLYALGEGRWQELPPSRFTS